MELKKLKYRELDKMYLVIYTIKTPVQLEVEGRVKTRNMYTFIGITVKNKRSGNINVKIKLIKLSMLKVDKYYQFFIILILSYSNRLVVITN